MCGIVGAIGTNDITSILVDGLKRLEYRGYDSAGIAILDSNAKTISRIRTEGKVSRLVEALHQQPLQGHIGIAHTRWATHGVPSEHNAHPHVSHNIVAVVHNGIIENHEALRKKLSNLDYRFSSETDTEVVVHLVHHYAKSHNFLDAVKKTVAELEGAYALAFINSDDPTRIIAVRNGSPLVIGLGYHANYLASDSLALIPITERFIYLEDGDMAELTKEAIKLFDSSGKTIERQIHVSKLNKQMADRGEYRHFMQKEIFEQPRALCDTMEGRISKKHVLDAAFGTGAAKIFDQTKHVQLAACGTSYHASLVGRYWLEGIANVSAQAEIASEIRYRKTVVNPNTLFVTLSQSGETADTLAALRQAKQLGYQSTLAICNVPESSLVREADFVLLTRAGTEIGVASTKAFTTQLLALLMLTLALGHRNGLKEADEAKLIEQMTLLPQLVEETLKLDAMIAQLASRFADKEHALFLGRGIQYPIAMEGALKLKELSYIHAEAYPAGELKHGPLALVDKNMPVIAIAPNDELLEKLKSNLFEVKARGGELIIFADRSINLEESDGITIIPMPKVDHAIAPIVYTLPLQLLAYHVAVLKGTDVDQPRNLAKSVTVE